MIQSQGGISLSTEKKRQTPKQKIRRYDILGDPDDLQDINANQSQFPDPSQSNFHSNDYSETKDTV